MNQSPTIAEIAKALAKAQASIEGAKKDSQNPFFKSRYADLDSVWTACKKPLSDNELAVIQITEGTAESLALVTILTHSSGEWIKGVLPLCPVKYDPQGIGSAITYARRYALAAMVGVCQVDDDGEAAMATHRKEDYKPKAPVPIHSNKLTEEQRAALDSYIQDDKEGEDKIKKLRNLKSVYDMDSKDFPGIINTLKKRKEEKENGKSKVA